MANPLSDRRAGGQLDDGHTAVDGGAPQAQEEDRQLLAQVAGQHHHARGRARLVDRGPGQAEHHLGRQAVAELGVDRVGADDPLGQLGPGVGVLVGQPGPADHADGARRRVLGPDLGQALGHRVPSASPHDTGSSRRRRPGATQSGSVSRSSALTASKPKRPLSHSQPWLTGSLSIPSRRVTRFDDDCTAARHPKAHSVHVDSTWSRSQGRAVNR